MDFSPAFQPLIATLWYLIPLLIVSGLKMINWPYQFTKTSPDHGLSESL